MKKTTQKLKIAVLYGGQSSEHDVSVTTAEHFFSNYKGEHAENLTKIFITKEGDWTDKSKKVNPMQALKDFDLVIPILHGQYGEDGRMQGLLEMAGVPYVGTTLQGSVVGFDKILSKKLVRDAGLLIADFLTITEYDMPDFEEVKEYFGLPFFIKPSRSGSSVGVRKVTSEKEYKTAVAEALTHDTRVLCERAIIGREVEVGVIGFGENTAVSVVGEIVIPEGTFFDYEQKYNENSKTTVVVPADLSGEVSEEIKDVARIIYETLHCDGMARVDFFLTKDNEIIFNEVNTIPGPVMFTKLWQASGVNFSGLVDQLIENAL